ncbi:Uncharacterised protein [uncultured archaeon]|nr:Uncharacterised protein [uncultured archaeon]
MSKWEGFAKALAKIAAVVPLAKEVKKLADACSVGRADCWIMNRACIIDVQQHRTGVAVARIYNLNEV